MKRSQRWPLAVVTFCAAFFVGIGSSQAQDPIPTGAMAPIRKSFMRAVKGYELRIADDYARHTKDPPELRERAQQLLVMAKRAEVDPPIDWSREKLHAVGSKLMEDGSSDPLVIAVTLQSLPNFDDYEQIAANCQKAIKDVVEIYGPRQQVQVIQWCQQVESALTHALWKMRTQKRTDFKYKSTNLELLYDAHVRWLETEPEDTAAQRYMWHVMTEHYFNPREYYRDGLVAVGERSRDKKIHPWMRHMLDAFALHESGNRMSRKRQAGYQAKLEAAAKKYAAAWELEQSFPEPAAELLLLTRGNYSEGTAREWFDRVMLGEIDYPKAYTYYRTLLRRQGADALIAFGDECAATERYDTKVPFELLECLWAVENQTGENIWARKGVYEKVRSLCKKALKAPEYLGEKQNAGTRAWLYGTQIMIAARANRFEEIMPIWDKTDTAALKRLAQIYHVDTPLPSLKAAAAAAASDVADLAVSIEAALSKVDGKESLKEAAKQVESAATSLPLGHPRLTHWQATVALLRDFYDDRWAQMSFSPEFPELAGTEKWSREDENTLVARGCEELPLEAMAQLPLPLELQVEIKSLEAPEAAPVAGFQVGRRQRVPNLSGKGTFVGLNAMTNDAIVFHQYLQRHLVNSFKESNKLRIRVWPGYLELFVNDKRVSTVSAFDFSPGGHLSLWVPGPADAAPRVQFKDLQVRRLSFGPPPSRKRPLGRAEYFTARLVDEPKNEQHRLDRADAYFAAELMDKAIEDYDQLLKTRADWQHVILQKGRAHAASGEHSVAIEQYKKLLELPPVKIRRVVANRFDSQGRRVQDDVKIPIFHMRALERWAWLEATCNDAEIRDGKSAVEHANRAIELGRNRYSECYLTLAVAYAESGKMEEARKALKRAGNLAGQKEQKLLEPVRKAFEQGQPYRDPKP